MPTLLKENNMAGVVITPLTNGPYVISGPVKLLNPGGTEVEVKQEKIALCRCGASASKPFCDGTHQRVNFRSEAAEAQTT